MAERTDSFQGHFNPNRVDNFSEAASEVKSSIEQLVADFDLQAVAKKIDEFGKQNPIGLALTALTLGLAVGVLVRSPKRLSMQ